MTEKKWVYLFSEIKEVEKYVNHDWEGVRSLLGGKGANLAEMARIGLPVPPGFTVTTEACNAYQVSQQFPDGMWEQMLSALQKIEKQAGKKFGSTKNPLLVSCRSGAKFSMPGMMDTVLNIGLNDETAKAMIRLTQNERFVYDSYRRLIQMFGSVVLGIEDEAFEEHLEGVKRIKGYKLDTQLTVADLKDMIAVFKQVVKDHKGIDFPQDPFEQLKLATEAVFKSWNGKRAVDYRRATNIPDDLGTAVSIVTMVLGTWATILAQVSLLLVIRQPVKINYMEIISLMHRAKMLSPASATPRKLKILAKTYRKRTRNFSKSLKSWNCTTAICRM